MNLVCVSSFNGTTFQIARQSSTSKSAKTVQLYPATFFQTFSGERLVVDHLYIQRTSPKLDCDVSRVQIHNTDPIQISH